MVAFPEGPAPRELRAGHTLTIEVHQFGKRPNPRRDTITVVCSCGETLTHSNFTDAEGALTMAEVNHRLFGPTAIGFDDVNPWHGTPCGYLNHGCECDPCRWAYESFRRHEHPYEAAPLWLDDWLGSGAPIPSFAPLVTQHYGLLTTTRGV